MKEQDKIRIAASLLGLIIFAVILVFSIIAQVDYRNSQIDVAKSYLYEQYGYDISSAELSWIIESMAEEIREKEVYINSRICLKDALVTYQKELIE